MAIGWGADPSATGSAGSPAPDPAIDAVLTAVAALQESDPALLTPSALGERVRRAGQALAMLCAHQVDCVGVMDARGDAQTLGFRSTQSWLRTVARVAPGAAKGLTALARRLRDRAVIEASFAAGRISLPHAQQVARTMTELAPWFPDEHERATMEADLVDLAERTDPLTLSRACQRLRVQAAPEQANADDWDAFQQRDLSISGTFAGMTVLNGTLDRLSAETVTAAVQAFAAPQGDDDLRTAGQRRADALVEICRRVLTFSDTPICGGERPQVNVIVPLATLEERAGVEPGELAWSGAISSALVRRILCDSAVTRIIVDGHSQPLDVGRTTRVVPTGLRKAVMIRDRHCQWPGCDVPAVWCDCHHMRHWSRGGPTSLRNLIMLCGYHHTRLHLAGLAIIRHPDGRVELIPGPYGHDGEHHNRGP